MASHIEPLLFRGKLNRVTVVMHGEEHLNIDNSYYEKLRFKPADLIFVEHSTDACELKPEHEHLFRQHAKGSEWVFYTQKKLNNPNVVCFDTRSEQGYLNAFQERRLLQLADQLPVCSPPEIKEYLDGVMLMITAFTQNQDHFEPILPGYYDRSMDIIQSQLKACTNLLRIKHREGASFHDILKQVLSGVGYALMENLKKAASVSTDISLAAALINASSSEPKPETIHVFCGRNHLVRMATMLDFKFRKGEVAFTEEHLATADMELHGDLAMDRKLQELKSSAEFNF
jgi:hypothetical protein